MKDGFYVNDWERFIDSFPAVLENWIALEFAVRIWYTNDDKWNNFTAIKFCADEWRVSVHTGRSRLDNYY